MTPDIQQNPTLAVDIPRGIIVRNGRVVDTRDTIRERGETLWQALLRHGYRPSQQASN